jgi:hypothetical protein
MLMAGLLAAAELMSGCAGTVQGDLLERPDIFAQTLRKLPDQQKRDFFLQWYTVMKIVEPQGSPLFINMSQLDAVKNEAKADSLIHFWWRQKDLENRPDTPDTNEWLGTMKERIAYCNSQYHTGDRYRYWNDMRAQAIILHGPPDQITTVEDSCWDRFQGFYPGTCEIYYLDWDGGTVRLGFIDSNGDGYTDHMVPAPEDIPLTGTRLDPLTMAQQRLQQEEADVYYNPDEEVNLFKGVKRELKPALTIASFPDKDGSYSVWASAGISTDQIEDRYSGYARFWSREVVYRNPDYNPEVAWFDSTLAIFNNSDIGKQAMYPFYRGCRLPAGRYQYILSIYTPDSALGIIKHDFELPSKTASMGASDVLLLLSPPTATRDPYGRIARDSLALRGNSYPVYYPDDTLEFYTELNFAAAGFSIDANGKHQYRVYVTLSPVTTNRVRELIQQQHPFVWSDTTSSEEIRKLMEARPDPTKEGTLIYSSARADSSSSLNLYDKAPVPNILQGRYYLVLRVDDVLSPASIIAIRELFVRT